MSTSPFHTENAVPYDFQGGADTCANPWNASGIASGSHSITQKVTLSAGGTEVDTANFSIGPLLSTSVKITATWDTGAAVAGTVTLSQPVVGAPDIVLAMQTLSSTGTATASVSPRSDGSTLYLVTINNPSGIGLYQSPVFFGSPGASVADVTVSVTFRSVLSSNGSYQVVKATYQATIAFPVIP